MSQAYLHIVLNHFPLIGLLIGALLLAVALVRKSADLRAGALVVIALSGLLAWPVAETGEGAEDAIQTLLDPAGRKAFDAHEERAEKTVPAALISAALAVLALVATRKKPELATRISLLCLASCLISLALIGWTAKAGGQIRHAEFRQNLPQ